MAPTRDPYTVALRALGRRDLSAAELEARLERVGFPPEERAATIARLAGAGYVSDGRAARERARVLADRGRGDAAIRADLQARGISGDLIDAVLAELPPEAVRAEGLSQRGGSSAKLVQALRRRGFSEETVLAVAERRWPGVG